MPLLVTVALLSVLAAQGISAGVGQSAAAPARTAVVTARNPIDLARAAETLTILSADIQRLLGIDDLRQVQVRDAAGQVVISQAIDLHDDGKFDELVFQADFERRQAKTFTLTVGNRLPLRVRDFKAYGRFVRERRDDFAWENDRIAHRMYGPALETWAQEPLTSSAVDAWTKRVRRLVINDWYMVDDYHQDNGTGGDFYSAGKSRGCGGSGPWVGGRLYPSANFRNSRVLANGPIRVMFELMYEPWDAGGARVSEVKRITLDAGQNLGRYESFYSTQGKAPISTHAAGIKKSSGSTSVTRRDLGVLRTWEPLKGHGNLGCAVVINPADVIDFLEGDGNYLAVAKVPADGRSTYHAGFGWDGSGDFATAEEWDRYLEQAARRLRAPVEITVEAPPEPPSREPTDADLQPAAVLEVMTRAADWQLAHPSTHPPYDWTQAAFYTGMLALADVSRDLKYVDAMRAMGDANRWRPGPRPGHADDHAVIATYARLSQIDGDEKMLAAGIALFDFLASRPYDEPLAWGNGIESRELAWCDALFMSPPAMAAASTATGEPKYLALANRLWWKTTEYLYDKHEHLYFRDSRYFDRREPNGRKVFWSRGNGWVIAGLARMLQDMPADFPYRSRYVRLFTEMAEKTAGLQGEDGYWRASLLDPGSLPNPETSGTGFFTYALAWGVNHGLLDRAAYGPHVRRGWAAMRTAVQPDGMLGWVQPIGAEPGSSRQDTTEVYGVGALLLAGSEVHRLVSAR